jgi:hypothetical protein
MILFKVKVPSRGLSHDILGRVAHFSAAVTAKTAWADVDLAGAKLARG